MLLHSCRSQMGWFGCFINCWSPGIFMHNSIWTELCEKKNLSAGEYELLTKEIREKWTNSSCQEVSGPSNNHSFQLWWIEKNLRTYDTCTSYDNIKFKRNLRLHWVHVHQNWAVKAHQNHCLFFQSLTAHFLWGLNSLLPSSLFAGIFFANCKYLL